MQHKTDSSLKCRGKLFVFEGADGVGKSTFTKEAAEYCRGKGEETLILSFPGREENSLGKIIYDIHHNAESFGIRQISPTSLQTLHIAAHIDWIENRILPALSNGLTVILDRFWWSTVAYGIAADISKDVLTAMIGLEKITWRDVKPDILFLITREEPFRAELSNEKWSRVCEAYKALTQEENGKYFIEIVENSKSLKEMTDWIAGRFEAHEENEISKTGQSAPFSNSRGNTKTVCNKKGRWTPTITTEVFDTYWRFAAERQAIFFKRLKGQKEPWTDDPILGIYKFTNAYRASDRVSQFLIRNVIYEGDQEPEEIVFRTLLFKTFNKIETWNLLVRELGEISWKEYDYNLYDGVLTKAKEKKTSIYSAAYIMPSGGRIFGHHIKHRNHLGLLEKMMKDDIALKIMDAKSMQKVFELIRGYPMIGDFLAYQYTVDINYSILTDFSEMSFVVPGPGAKNGLRKCFSDFGGLGEIDLIKLMADRQKEEFLRLGIEFENLWGRNLQLIDCQNLFCEVDKYARVAHPEIQGLTKRNRIKQKFRPSALEPIKFFYPPKWEINDFVEQTIIKSDQSESYEIPNAEVPFERNKN